MKEQSNIENKQKVEKNLVAISQIIIFQLLIITVGTVFEHYSYEMSEFKPNEPSTMNL